MPAKRSVKSAANPITLNEEQQAVVSAGVGNWRVVAGPGSGKSKCLVERYVRLVQDGVDPSQILSLSFTATAAKNLRGRVEAQVGKISTNRKVAGSVTFHSLALSMAIEEREEYPFELAEFPLAPESVANKMSGNAARKHDIDPRSLRSALQLYRRNRVSAPEALRIAENKLDAKEIKMALAYKMYSKQCKEAGLLDFDDLLFHMVNILEKKPAVRARYQYQYVMADECQDNCQTDWSLLKLVSEKFGNLLTVGDPGQNIFSFRGSSSQLFMDMGASFPNTQTLFLAENFRSSPQIVDFIRPYAASEELASKFRAHKSEGPMPKIQGFLNAGDECAWVVKQLSGVSE